MQQLQPQSFVALSADAVAPSADDATLTPAALKTCSSAIVGMLEIQLPIGLRQELGYDAA